MPYRIIWLFSEKLDIKLSISLIAIISFHRVLVEYLQKKNKQTTENAAKQTAVCS